MSLELLDWKIVASIASTIFGVGFSLPYIWQIFKRKTKPHAYTWLIWCITCATAAAGVWFGGGGVTGTAPLALAVGITLFIFLLSFKYGTKNVTKSDAIVLVFALGATFVWWGLDNPLLAVLLATGIDLIGYIPTFRKSFSEPRSENILAWIGFTIAPALTILALSEYSLMTVVYSGATFVINLILVAFLLLRRRMIHG